MATAQQPTDVFEDEAPTTKRSKLGDASADLGLELELDMEAAGVGAEQQLASG